MKFDVYQYFEDSSEEAKGGPEGSHQGSRTVPGAPLGHAGDPPGPLVPLQGLPSGLYYPLGVETLKREEFQSFTAASWRKPTKKKKPSPTGRFRRGDHLTEGEIITTVIVIVTGIIAIIINIIPNISTISTSIPSHLRIATCVVIRTIYPLYSVGVDYYFVVNAIEFCWKNIIVQIVCHPSIAYDHDLFYVL